MTGTVNSEAVKELKELKKEIAEKYKEVKKQASEDLAIDEFDLDKEILRTPKLHSKYNEIFTDETMILKDFYSFKKKVELERWKYWSGKQTDKYYADNGIQHEKILKGDIDKYLSSDDKLSIVDDIITVQKALVDFTERTLKEIGNRQWEVRAAIDWRKFTSGG